MLELDHITVVAPSLAEGVAHVREAIGVDVPFGRRHTAMGTHNHLLRLGEAVYLEIIAADPTAPRPSHPRWFGLDDTAALRAAWDKGHRLRGWVVRTTRIEQVLRAHGDVLGRRVRLPSGAGSFFDISVPPDGSLPLRGAAPSVIDRQGRPPSTGGMLDAGIRLHSLLIEHPDPPALQRLLWALRIDTPPEVRHGDEIRLRARLRTPDGVRDLS
jgi:hypothetical protein